MNAGDGRRGAGCLFALPRSPHSASHLASPASPAPSTLLSQSLDLDCVEPLESAVSQGRAEATPHDPLPGDYSDLTRCPPAPADDQGTKGRTTQRTSTRPHCAFRQSNRTTRARLITAGSRGSDRLRAQRKGDLRFGALHHSRHSALLRVLPPPRLHQKTRTGAPISAHSTL